MIKPFVYSANHFVCIKIPRIAQNIAVSCSFHVPPFLRYIEMKIYKKHFLQNLFETLPTVTKCEISEEKQIVFSLSLFISVNFAFAFAG